MANQLQKYQQYRGLIRGLLVGAGIWPIMPKHKVTNILYRQVPFLAIICCVGMCYGLQRFCREHSNNMAMLTKGLSLLVSTSLIWLKVIFFLAYRQQLFKMVTILETLIDDMLQSPHFWPPVFSHFTRFYYSALFIFSSVFCLCVTYTIIPYIMILHQYAKNVAPEHCVFPYPTSFPWLMDDCGIVYKAITLFETVTSWFVITVTSGTDTFFGHCMFQISAILRAISHEFENVNTENCEYIMHKCVDKHNQLILCRNILQDVFSAIVLYVSISNALIMCAVIYQSYQAKLTIVSGALFLSYILLKLSQTFCYAWYGSIITLESEAFQRAVYFSNWHTFGNTSFSRGVLIIMSQKPMAISAYNFFPVSMELFTGILNTTASYFFLLKALDETTDG